MRHVFVSPHLDDAALSCGGTIHRLCAEEQGVLVVTVCAGAPSSADMSPYAVELHERWREASDSPEQMVAARRAEDRVAMGRLGAAWCHLDVPDAPYRRDHATGAWLYDGDDAIFGPVAAGDDTLEARIADAIAEVIGQVTVTPGGRPDGEGIAVYTPLTVGNHVDHQLVRRASERWAGGRRTLLYYEDLPYAMDDEAVRRAVDRQTGGVLQPRLSRLTPDDLDAKVEAVASYASQISTFWGSHDEMESAVRDVASRRGGSGLPAERLLVLGRPEGRGNVHDADDGVGSR